jgi:hypothetical protein
MSKLKEHLKEATSMIGSRNNSIPMKEVADAIGNSMEQIQWELEGIAETGGVNANHKKQLAKTIITLRKLNDAIVKDLLSQEK